MSECKCESECECVSVSVLSVRVCVYSYKVFWILFVSLGCCAILAEMLQTSGTCTHSSLPRTRLYIPVLIIGCDSLCPPT